MSGTFNSTLVFFVGLICGVTVGGLVLIAVIISIFCRSYLWCYSRWCGLDCCNRHYNLQNEVRFKVALMYGNIIHKHKTYIQINSDIYTLTDHKHIYGFGLELRKPPLSYD